LLHEVFSLNVSLSQLTFRRLKSEKCQQILFCWEKRYEKWGDA